MGNEATRPTAPPQSGEAGRYDAFLSYARKDEAAAERLGAALEAQGKQVWVDVDDILGGADWRDRIKRGIEACKAFLFLLSADSLSSQPCRAELEQAEAMNKLIIPVYHRDADESELFPELASREWIFLRERDDFDAGLAKLVEALEADVEWRDEHTRIAGRTREWLDGQRDKSFLLRGSALRDAEGWLSRQADHRETATAGQAQYIVESRRAASARQRTLMVSVVTGALIALGSAVFALVQRNTALDEKRLALARELAAESHAQASQDPERALLLAVESVRTREVDQTVDALREALATTHLRAILRSGSRPVTSASYSADGKMILTAGGDGKVRLWRSVGGAPSVSFRAGPPAETHASFADRDRLVLSVNGRSGTRLWNTRTQHVVRALPDRGAHVVNGAVSADGTRIVTIDEGGIARLWTAGRPDGRILRPPRSERITSVAMRPDGRLVATASDDFGRVRVWPVGRSASSRALGSKAAYSSVAFTADGRGVIAGDRDDGSVLAWKVRGGPATTVTSGSGGAFYPLTPLAARDSGRGFLATAFADGTLVVRDVITGGADFTTQTSGGKVHDVGFAPDGQTIVTAQDDGTARVFAVTPVDALSARLRGARTALNNVVFSPRGRVVAAADNAGTVHVWTRDGTPVRTVTGEPPPRPTDTEAPELHVTISPDGNLLAIAGAAGTSLWPMSGRRPSLRLPGPSSDAAFSPDGRRIVVAAQSGVAQVRRVSDGRVIRRLGDTGGQPLLRVSFNQDSGRVLGVAGDGRVRVWSVADRRPPLVLGDRSTTISAASFSPDGERVALARDDGRLAVVDLADSAHPEAVAIGPEMLTSVAWSPDGRLLLVAAGNGKATVLDAAKLRVLTTLVGDGESLTSAAFDPSGTRVALAGDDTAVGVYRCELCGTAKALLATARSVAARRLTEAERRRYLNPAG